MSEIPGHEENLNYESIGVVINDGTAAMHALPLLAHKQHTLKANWSHT